MTQLERFWPAIESVPGPAAVASEWRRLLGPEYDLVQTWLRPRHDLATSVPCLRYPGAVHRIVDHGGGEYVAVCPEGCEKQALAKGDLAIYVLDRVALMMAVTAAFEWPLQLEQSGSLPHTERMATLAPTAGYRFPVFLAIAAQGDEMLAAVRAITATSGGPFILFAPTHQFWTSACDQLLAAQKAIFLPLNETFALDDRGRLVLVQPSDKLLAEFHGAVLPSQETRDGMVFFPTPDGATWRDVTITFETQHTVEVDVLGVRGSHDYSQMGMADRRNGKPNRQWELLRAFAEGDGTLDWKSPHADRRNQKRRETLAKDLQRFFRIEGDPIQQQGKGWQMRFSVSAVD